MIEALVWVGWTSSRPLVPDEHVSAITVVGSTVQDCTLAAIQIVACRPECEMPTSHSLVGAAEIITEADWQAVGFYPAVIPDPPF